MPLDPAIRQMLDTLEQHNLQGMASVSPEQARAAFRLITVDLRRPETVPPVAAVEEVTIPAAEGELPARIYRPEAEGPVPTILFLHGGGFCIGDIDTHDSQARHLCREVGAVVVSASYRLAPEHPFPAAVEDAFAAVRWVGEHVAELGADPDGLAVAGDSAGGNLSAVVAQLARDSDSPPTPPLAAQLLIYPATHAGGEYASREENATGYFLTAEDMAWFDHNYGPADSHDDPRRSPLLADDLSGLPPAVVVTAEFDPLRDEGEAYARALEAAGVPVDLRRYDGLIHGFFDLSAVSPTAAEAVIDTCAALREMLDRVRESSTGGATR